MPGYADLAQVRTTLNLAPGDAQVRLDALNTAVSDLLDDAMGRTFAGGLVAETRTVRQQRPSPVVSLITPLVSIDQVELGGTWDGEQWTGATALDPDQYRLRAVDRDGRAWGVAVDRQADAYRITGVWGDQAGAVPDAVVEAATVLVAKSYQRDQAGPDGTTVGPDGMTIRPANPWADERVTRAIQAYRLPELIV